MDMSPSCCWKEGDCPDPSLPFLHSSPAAALELELCWAGSVCWSGRRWSEFLFGFLLVYWAERVIRGIGWILSQCQEKGERRERRMLLSFLQCEKEHGHETWKASGPVPPAWDPWAHCRGVYLEHRCVSSTPPSNTDSPEICTQSGNDSTQINSKTLFFKRKSLQKRIRAFCSGNVSFISSWMFSFSQVFIKSEFKHHLSLH